MLENKYKQMTISEHINLYDKIIPKEHFLRKLKENVDFSFVNELVKEEYSERLGRPAKEPEVVYTVRVTVPIAVYTVRVTVPIVYTVRVTVPIAVYTVRVTVPIAESPGHYV